MAVKSIRAMAIIAFFVSPPFFQSKVTAADFRKPLGLDSAQSARNKQRLDICPGPADPGGLFLPSALVVLRRKPSPGAKMLRGGEHGHIHANFRDNANCGKGLDTYFHVLCSVPASSYTFYQIYNWMR